MHFLSASLIILATAARFGHAEPVAFPLPVPAEDETAHNLTTRSDGWAYFCDDADCQTNCQTKGYSINDPGCFEVPEGRYSMHVDKKFKGIWYSLIHSPRPECPCQSSCDEYYGKNEHTTSCYKVEPGTSLRWISGICPTIWEDLCYYES